MKYLTLEDLQNLDKSDEVYVRMIILYAHKTRIQKNPAQIEAFKVIKKTIAKSQYKNHTDYVFARMCVSEVLLVFKQYFKDYKNFVTK